MVETSSEIMNSKRPQWGKLGHVVRGVSVCRKWDIKL